VIIRPNVGGDIGRITRRQCHVARLTPATCIPSPPLLNSRLLGMIHCTQSATDSCVLQSTLCNIQMYKEG